MAHHLIEGLPTQGVAKTPDLLIEKITVGPAGSVFLKVGFGDCRNPRPILWEFRAYLWGFLFCLSILMLFDFSVQVCIFISSHAKAKWTLKLIAFWLSMAFPKPGHEDLWGSFRLWGSVLRQALGWAPRNTAAWKIISCGQKGIDGEMRMFRSVMWRTSVWPYTGRHMSSYVGQSP